MVSVFFRSCKDLRKLQRNHMHLILNVVGQPLSRFNMTKVLSQAVCDAIKGHQQAHKIGILHRYISEGNILIVDSDSQPFQGMLVDFDYAFFYSGSHASGRAGEAKIASFAARKRRMQAAAQNVDGSQVSNELKERTRTLLFMAIAFLDLEGEEVMYLLQHDLESFYWVLVWIVLRHTRYTHPNGPTTCHKLFGGEDEFACRAAKLEWINSRRFVDVKDNEPLTSLLATLTRLVRDAHNNSEQLTYDSVLELFEEALLMDGWPTDDKAIPVQHIDTSKEVPVQNEPDVGVSGLLKRSADTEYPFVCSKRKKGDSETLSRHGQDHESIIIF
ncbi:hypothetical protein B0H21DRAFT_892220 [Amylocystis lapponica]|nr:hypothetical protein B0H21DRAFT_892220 [Amylocystis lapponica]